MNREKKKERKKTEEYKKRRLLSQISDNSMQSLAREGKLEINLR